MGPIRGGFLLRYARNRAEVIRLYLGLIAEAVRVMVFFC